MSRIWSILVLVFAVLLGGVARGAEPDSEGELKARFAERHDALQSLKGASKVGETSKGLISVVREAHQGDEVTLSDKTMTVGELVRAENEDRRQLYRIIGKRTGEPEGEVAVQAAIRNFRKASANHSLELPDGRWVKKRDLPKPK